MMDSYKFRFIDFLIHSGALTFGEFTLKSGRKAPYFVNTGNFNTGRSILELGEFYSAHIEALKLHEANVIFGPAYKGIPLAVATSIALTQKTGRQYHFSFDRKEQKDHGDRGALVGHSLKAEDRVIIVEDVITAGTTFKEIIPFIRAFREVSIDGIVVCVDRKERGTGPLSAIAEIEEEFGVSISPIVTIHDIVEYLGDDNASGTVLTKDQLDQIEDYLNEYGA